MAQDGERVMREKWLVPGPASSPHRTAPSQLPSEAHIYRPGVLLVAALIVSPALLSLIAAGISLAIFHAVLLVVPALLLLLLPAITGSWSVCVSIRTTPLGISSARMLRPWREIPWSLIEHAQRRGPRIVLVSSSGQQIAFVPWLLSDGTRLYRRLLVRLPAHVLDARMRTSARRLLGERIVADAQGGLSGSLTARPRTAWRVAALAAGCAALLLGIASLVLTHPPISLAIGLVSLFITAFTIALYGWFAQRIEVSDDGIQVTFPLRHSPQRMDWSEVALLEHSPAECVLRLRGDRRLSCAGPGMLRPEERDQFRAFLHTYCIGRGVPVAQRRWLA